MTSTHWLISAITGNAETQKPLQDLRLEGDIATKWGTVSRISGLEQAQIADAAAEHLGIPRADFLRLETAFARQVPENVARTHLIVPIVIEGSRAFVAVADPADSSILEDLAFSLGATIQICLATPGEIEASLTNIYGEDGGANQVPRNQTQGFRY